MDAYWNIMDENYQLKLKIQNSKTLKTAYEIINLLY